MPSTRQLVCPTRTRPSVDASGQRDRPEGGQQPCAHSCGGASDPAGPRRDLRSGCRAIGAGRSGAARGVCDARAPHGQYGSLASCHQCARHGERATWRHWRGAQSTAAARARRCPLRSARACGAGAVSVGAAVEEEWRGRRFAPEKNTAPLSAGPCDYGERGVLPINRRDLDSTRSRSY